MSKWRGHADRYDTYLEFESEDVEAEKEKARLLGKESGLSNHVACCGLIGIVM